MKRSNLLNTSYALALTILLAACGGGSEIAHTNDDNGAIASNGAQAASVYQGAITGFGSVIVNGVRFSSTGASIKDNDANLLTHDDLHIGTTVQVVGTGNDVAGTGTASSITVVHGVQGSISAITAPELTVLGQRVVTNAKTAYQNVSSLSSLAVGDTVEVYGPRQADGSVLASLIEKKIISIQALPGVVSSLNTATKTFSINGLTVNYASAVVTGVLANGVSVKAKATAPAIAGVLTATQVVVYSETSEYGTNAAGVIKIKGVAGGAPVAGILTVSGTTVNVANALFQGGTAIVSGSVLEIRGTWNGTTLMANLVEFEGARDAQVGGSNELYGLISAFTSISNFVVNGVTVDGSSAVVTGTLSSLVTGAYIEVKGNMVGNVFKATRIELKNPNAPTGGYYETYGLVSNYVSMASFIVNGMSVNASAAIVEHPERGVIANGRTVEMKGSQNASGVFIAVKIELK
jgi:hypothetical protein